MALPVFTATLTIVRRNGVRTLTVRAFPDERHFASQLLAAARPKLGSLKLPEGQRRSVGEQCNRQNAKRQGAYGSRRKSEGAILHAFGIAGAEARCQCCNHGGGRAVERGA